MINWKELFENKHNCFHSENRETIRKLLQIAHDLGYKWTDPNAIKNNKTSLIEYDKWGYFGSKTYYRMCNQAIGSVTKLPHNNNDVILNVDELLNLRKPFKLNRK